MTVGEILVSYVDEGSPTAPVVIFIHGFPLNKSCWDEQLDLLKNEYRVIAYDVRGHGHSDAGAEPFSMEQFVADLFSFMEALGVQKATLCGLSIGGYIALAASAQDPQRIVNLILCDTQCTADTDEAKLKRSQTILSVQANGMQKYAADSIEKLFSKISLSTRHAAVSAVEDIILHTPIETITKTLLALAGRSETCSSLSDLKIPVLIIVGAEDQITPPEAAQQMHQLIPQSELKIIEDAGHLSNLEAPERFNGHLQTFLNSLQKK